MDALASTKTLQNLTTAYIKQSMNEKTYELHQSTLNNPQYKKLAQSLKHWLNSFNTRGVAVVDIYNDLGVAYVVAQLIEKVLPPPFFVSRPPGR